MGDDLIEIEPNLAAETEFADRAVLLPLLFCSQLASFVNQDVSDVSNLVYFFADGGEA